MVYGISSRRCAGEVPKGKKSEKKEVDWNRSVLSLDSSDPLKSLSGVQNGIQDEGRLGLHNTT